VLQSLLLLWRVGVLLLDKGTFIPYSPAFSAKHQNDKQQVENYVEAASSNHEGVI